MKLLTKTRRYYLSLFLLILAIWTIIFAVAFHYLMIDSVDEALINQKVLVLKELKKEKSLQLPINNELMSIKKVRGIKDIKPSFKNVRMFSRGENEIIPFRQYKAEVAIDHHNYVLTIRKSLLEHDDLIVTILLTEAVLIILLFIGFYFVNNRILYQLWEPFYQSLNRIKKYKLASGGSQISFPGTEIQEFQDLNQELNRMISKIQKDYENLKEFTENASHELQTPLSVIKSKMELLMQGENDKQEQMELISDAYDAVGKLAKLNQALLLLARIENNQYPKYEDVNLSSLLEDKVEVYEDITELKQLDFDVDIDDGVTLKMNSYLAEVLLNNLLSNSIKHNYEGGHVRYMLNKDSLIIANTGKEPDIKVEKLFNRFQKAGDNRDSIGLGLAIVKAICDLYHFRVNYLYKNNLHTIQIDFNSSNSVH